MSKIITVFGATGNQGGSVLSAVLASPTLSKTFKLRGITRDPSKPSGQSLAAKGIELQKADMNNKESLQAAIKGSYAVFAVTNFWETRSEEIEVKQGKNMADACLVEGVKHLIWSTLPYVTKLTKGQYTHVDHFDGKAKITEYIESIKGDKMTATYFMPGYYATNIKSNIRAGPDGVPTLSLPWDAERTLIPAFSPADDAGKFVTGILSQDLASVNGKYIHAVSEWVTPAKMVEALSAATGKEINFNQLSDEEYLKMLPPALALELGETMFLIRDYSYYGLGEEKNQSESDAILLEGVKPMSWVEFVENNKPWELTSPPQNDRHATPYKVGIIGYGLSAKIFHIPFLTSPSTKHLYTLHAIVQRTPDPANNPAKDHPGTTIYRTSEALFADPAINLIIITTSPTSHFTLATQALNAGKNVVVEKPFVPTSAEAYSLASIALSKNLLLTVYQNRRFDADFLLLSRLIREELLGRVVEFETHFDRHRPDVPSAQSWKNEAAPGTGAVYDLGST